MCKSKYSKYSIKPILTVSHFDMGITDNESIRELLIKGKRFANTKNIN